MNLRVKSFNLVTDLVKLNLEFLLFFIFDRTNRALFINCNFKILSKLSVFVLKYLYLLLKIFDLILFVLYLVHFLK